eukprot:CAMPEP_0171105404 /NCGR_PEP_ID=MMETSP0766_2-20121228/62605_1 /TAXON_ID=439317 /ORGANISM="Gambierdiscus australes, Strain CAWD 149" /LENGTH=253 /DNA_ID=CAMNT_0011566249 /DNA_START=1 /DNA_END=762 /DNA_ORIENTATION=+
MHPTRDAMAYKPWLEDQLYQPGQNGTPSVRPRSIYGQSPEVGDIPRIGKRPGDSRCNDLAGSPCSLCVAEKIIGYHYDAKKVLPGFESAEAMGKNWFTGLPSCHPHPFQAATPEMNTGRGCNTFGEVYDAPPRYSYLEIYKFDETVEEYTMSKGIEVDWGPPKDSEEFRQGMMSMKQTNTFKTYAHAMRSRDPEWVWKNPEERRPWERIEKVSPVAREIKMEHPIDQHIQRLQHWGSRTYEPWPEWGLDPEGS